MNGLKKCLLVGMTATLSVTLYAFGSSSPEGTASAVENSNSYNGSLYKLEMSLNNLANAGNRMYLSQNGESMNYFYNDSAYIASRTQNTNGQTGLSQNSSRMTGSSASTSGNSFNTGFGSSVNSNSSNNSSNAGLSTASSTSTTTGTANTNNTAGTTTSGTGTTTADSTTNSGLYNANIMNDIRNLKSNAESLRTMLFNGNYNATSSTALDDCCRVLNMTSNSINRYVNDYQYASLSGTNSNTGLNYSDRLIRSNIRISNQAINSLKSGFIGSNSGVATLDYVANNGNNSNTTTNTNTTGSTDSSTSSGSSTQIQPRVTRNLSSRTTTNSRVLGNGTSRPSSSNPYVRDNYLTRNSAM